MLNSGYSVVVGAPAGGTAVLEPTTNRDVDETPDTGGNDQDYAGWFCVETDPFPCPKGCGFVANHMTLLHFIVVWPESDDPNMLRHCGIAKTKGRNPKVVEYEPDFGRCLSYYRLEAAGFPACGRIDF